jgi:hypothetical protein
VSVDGRLICLSVDVVVLESLVLDGDRVDLEADEAVARAYDGSVIGSICSIPNQWILSSTFEDLQHEMDAFGTAVDDVGGS